MFVGPLPPPLGGVAIMNQSCQNLSYNGCKVISFDTSTKIEREDIYSRFKIKSIVRNLTLIMRLKLFIKENKPDLINIFVTSGKSIVRDLLFLKIISKFNIPIVVHFHSKTHGEFGLVPYRLKIVAKYFNHYANRIILLSDYHYSYFIKYFDQEKCSVIENFVKYSDFQNEISTKNDDFLFVGRLSKEKGFFDLLNAVKLLKEKKQFCRIQVIGLAPTYVVETEINDFINEYELNDYFIFNGATFGEAKNRAFQKSICLIFPSHFENSPVVLKEAIAAKMAILASDIAANKNVLKSRENYLTFETGNQEELSSAIIELMSNRSRVLEMCKASSMINDYDEALAEKMLNKMLNEISSTNEK